MSRSAAPLAALVLLSLGTPVWADAKLVQSPLMMRRAGPSCRPGNLQGEDGAGYLYALGPCAEVYRGEDDAPARGRTRGRHAHGG